MLAKKLKTILRLLAETTLKKYNPGIIGITGSVGKTSTKEAIYTVLRNFRRVRVSSGSFNNEFGLPITILGAWSEEELELISRKYGKDENKLKKILFLIKVILVSLGNLIFRTDYPDILILEYGADRPGDLDYLLAMAKPQISVVTAIGDIPAHSEFYSGPDEVAKEKSKLIRALSVAGFAVLNFDDEAVLNMKNLTSVPIFTYGFGEGAQVKIDNFENRSDQGKPAGITFRLNNNNNSLPVRIDGAFGKVQAYAAAAATCIGLGFGLNLGRIVEALAYYRAPSHRLKFLMGIKDTYLVDDSYNSSPLSMRAAIETIKDFSAKRKVAILGDMLELGEYTIEVHEAIGQLIPKNFNLLITVGARAKFIADAARKKGMNDKKIISFDTVDEAIINILGLLKSGDLVLIKASRGIGLDKLVEEVMYKN